MAEEKEKKITVDDIKSNSTELYKPDFIEKNKTTTFTNNINDIIGGGMLHITISYNNLDYFKYINKFDPDIFLKQTQHKDKMGRDCLVFAAIKAKFGFVEYMLDSNECVLDYIHVNYEYDSDKKEYNRTNEFSYNIISRLLITKFPYEVIEDSISKALENKYKTNLFEYANDPELTYMSTISLAIVYYNKPELVTKMFEYQKTNFPGSLEKYNNKLFEIFLRKFKYNNFENNKDHVNSIVLMFNAIKKETTLNKSLSDEYVFEYLEKTLENNSFQNKNSIKNYELFIIYAMHDIEFFKSFIETSSIREIYERISDNNKAAFLDIVKVSFSEIDEDYIQNIDDEQMKYNALRNTKAYKEISQIQNSTIKDKIFDMLSIN